MSSQVVFLDSAEQDLKDLKHYIVKRFGQKTWQTVYREIRGSVYALRTFPLAGGVPEELRSLNFSQFRQVIAGRNRIIYEIRQGTVFVHIICDTRRDMRSLLTARLLRAP